MSGVSTAYHLLGLYEEKLQPSIVLLDARQVCSGATGRNGGHIKYKSTSMHTLAKRHGIDAAEELAAFVHDVVDRIKDVVDKEVLQCEFELRRTYDVFLDEEEAREAEKAFVQSRENGEKWTRTMDFVSKDFVEQVTSIKGAKAAISGAACSLWPYKFVTQLLERIVDRVNLQTNTKVTNISHDRDSKYQTLTTSRGELKAKKIVFATNAYTGGISPTYKNKIVPYRGTASHLQPKTPISPHLSHTYNLAFGTHVDYLNPRPDGGIVVGGAKVRLSEDRSLWYNNWDDSKLIPNVDDYFDDLMQRNFKGWENSQARMDHLWTGIMGLTAEGMPHIGEVPGMEGKQYIMAGFNGGGMPIIFSAALGLAKMVKDGLSFEDTGLPKVFKTSRQRLEEPLGNV